MSRPPRKTEPGYVARLNRVSELKDAYRTATIRQREILHGLVTELVGLYEDRDYWAKIEADGVPVTAELIAAEMDKHLDDLGCDFSFAQLRRIIERFPSADDWKARPLGDLYQESLQRDQVPEAPKTPRRTAKIADIERAETEKKEALAIAAKHAERCETLEEELRRLRDENHELRRRLDEKDREIASLKRSLLILQGEALVA